jgi:L-ascorbate metabolism protein UlaG (beta-lactamase superfamily)
VRQRNALNHWFIFAVLTVAIFGANVIAEVLYIDAKNGDDKNPGIKEKPLRTINQAAVMVNGKTESGPTTIRIAPGVYNLAKAVVFENTRSYTKERRLTIKATILPDDSNWKPALMPIILSTEIPQQWEKTKTQIETSGLKIEISHVTIRGLKFLGSPVSHIWYYPVFREGKNLEDLVVTQCLFIMDRNALSSNVAIIANGHGLVVDHCIFYNCRNPIVFWNADGGTSKNNAMRYCIVDGAYTSGVWVCQTAEDFKFHNNIIARSKYAWMRNSSNQRKYRLHDCIITDNECYSGECGTDWKLKATGPGIVYDEKDVIKTGTVVLEMGNGIDLPVPRNFLHPVPGTLGSDLGAGLFTKSATEIEPKPADSRGHTGQLEIKYIGHAAFRITDGQTTLVVDFPYGWGYMEYKMEDVTPIKDGLFLITHGHPDHWEGEVFEQMDKEMHLTIIGPPDVLEEVDCDRKIPFGDVDMGHRTDIMTYKDITIQGVRTPHWNWPEYPAGIQHYSYLVSWHGLRFYFPGDDDYIIGNGIGGDNSPPLISTIKNIDVMLIKSLVIQENEGKMLPIDAKTLILNQFKPDEQVPPFQNYLRLKQGEIIKVGFKEKHK